MRLHLLPESLLTVVCSKLGAVVTPATGCLQCLNLFNVTTQTENRDRLFHRGSGRRELFGHWYSAWA
ncbi:MAG: hypothetical protein K6T90_20870 [Leptolyngbyaceae cyanobacterium HOT.MB2.61]|nr:hypothetical protein [Leptolyngbyaceae cyanobacterium HOT.MB2.61]